MIWGSQWDAVMNWFLKDEKTKGYVTNSEGMGWYEDNYKDGNPNHETGKDIQGENGKVKNRIKNIYDMAGNVFEWTIEANNTNYRVCRGGYCDDSGSNLPASRRNNNNPDSKHSAYGSRSTLIVNLPAE